MQINMKKKIIYMNGTYVTFWEKRFKSKERLNYKHIIRKHIILFINLFCIYLYTFF